MKSYENQQVFCEWLILKASFQKYKHKIKGSASREEFMAYFILKCIVSIH